MFKAVPEAVGVLTADLSALSNILPVDSGMLAKLAAILDAAQINHTYVLIGDAAYLEIGRVTLMGGTAIVARGQDNTSAKAFSAGTDVAYEFCAAAAADMVQAVAPLAVTIAAAAPLVVAQPTVGNFQLSLAPIVVNSPDATVDVTGSINSGLLSLDVVRGTNGCC